MFGLSLSECRVIGVTGARSCTPFRQLCDEAELEKPMRAASLRA